MECSKAFNNIFLVFDYPVLVVVSLHLAGRCAQVPHKEYQAWSVSLSCLLEIIKVTNSGIKAYALKQSHISLFSFFFLFLGSLPQLEASISEVRVFTSSCTRAITEFISSSVFAFRKSCNTFNPNAILADRLRINKRLALLSL